MSVLSATATKEYCMELGNALPSPVLDKPEYRERRLITAVETFVALRPGDAYEARLAVRIVLCGAHAVESLRLANVNRADFAKTTRCRAQAASMMRAESSAKRALEREQKVRLATEAVAGAVGVANGARAEPEGASAPPPQAEPQAPPQIQAAASEPPPGHAAPDAAPPDRAEAAAAPSPAPEHPAVALLCSAAGDPVALPAQSGSAPPPSAEAIDRAEYFAMLAGVVAAQIRRDGGVTPQSEAYLRRVRLPADPALIDALVRGNTAALRVLDDLGGAMLDAAD